MTGFVGRYDHLRTQEIAPSRTMLFFANGMEGTTSGVETWASYQASDRWRLSAGFDALTEHFELKPGSNDVANLAAQKGRDPKRSWRLRSSLDLNLGSLSSSIFTSTRSAHSSACIWAFASAAMTGRPSP